MDFAKARRNMVESQLRPNRVTDPAIVAAMGTVPRERFVPETLADVAYIDEDLPLGGDRYLMEPMVFGRLLQEAMPGADDAALLVGCGTGYAAAVLARLCSAIFALESDSGTAAKAQALLSNLGADNVVVVEGPLEKGWADEAPYDLVLFDGAVAEVPPAIIDQLGENGRIAAVISDGDGPGRATLLQRRGGFVSRRTLFDANTPVLPGFIKSAGFVF
jgi:protein-L-isoaspartate(D-aspartate) O-methyltransferase